VLITIILRFLSSTSVDGSIFCFHLRFSVNGS